MRAGRRRGGGGHTTAKTPDPKNRQEIIGATKAAASSAGLAVTASSLVAPTINMPVCQDQLIDAAKVVESMLNNLLNKARVGCNDAQELNGLNAAAERVAAAINRLIEKTRQGGQKDNDISDVDRQAEIVLGDAQTFVEGVRDPNAVVGSARTLAVSATQLVNAMKAHAANETDQVEKARLINSARVLAEATARMVNAAKVGSGGGHRGLDGGEGRSSACDSRLRTPSRLSRWRWRRRRWRWRWRRTRRAHPTIRKSRAASARPPTAL